MPAVHDLPTKLYRSSDFPSSFTNQKFHIPSSIYYKKSYELCTFLFLYRLGRQDSIENLCNFAKTSYIFQTFVSKANIVINKKEKKFNFGFKMYSFGQNRQNI